MEFEQKSSATAYLYLVSPSNFQFKKRISWHLIHAGGNDEWDFYDDIVEYDPEKDTMTTVGHMIEARGFHAVSVVDASEYTKWCDGSM